MRFDQLKPGMFLFEKQKENRWDRRIYYIIFSVSPDFIKLFIITESDAAGEWLTELREIRSKFWERGGWANIPELPKKSEFFDTLFEGMKGIS